MAGNRVRYICPICDQEMKISRHFCWNCKSRVAEPWRFTGGHLPNEGHDGCHPSQTYMQPRTTGTPVRPNGSKSLAGKNNTSKQYTYNRPGQGSSPTRRPNSSSGRSGSYSNPNTYGGGSSSNTPRKKNTGCASLFVVGFIFYFVIQILLAFIGFF